MLINNYFSKQKKKKLLKYNSKITEHTEDFYEIDKNLLEIWHKYFNYLKFYISNPKIQSFKKVN